MNQKALLLSSLLCILSVHNVSASFFCEENNVFSTNNIEIYYKYLPLIQRTSSPSNNYLSFNETDQKQMELFIGTELLSILNKTNPLEKRKKEITLQKNKTNKFKKLVALLVEKKIVEFKKITEITAPLCMPPQSYAIKAHEIAIDKNFEWDKREEFTNENKTKIAAALADYAINLDLITTFTFNKEKNELYVGTTDGLVYSFSDKDLEKPQQESKKKIPPKKSYKISPHPLKKIFFDKTQTILFAVDEIGFFVSLDIASGRILTKKMLNVEPAYCFPDTIRTTFIILQLQPKASQKYPIALFDILPISQEAAFFLLTLSRGLTAKTSKISLPENTFIAEWFTQIKESISKKKSARIRIQKTFYP